MDDSQFRLPHRVVAFLERFLPDAFLFALVANAIVLVAGFFSLRAATELTRHPSYLTSLAQLLDAWGRGFFSLLPFTLQMAMVIISGHIVASAPPVARLLSWLSQVPRSPRGAVAWVTFFALVTSWL